MELEDSLSNYVLGDGQIISIKANLKYQERSKSTATELIIRKSAAKKKLEKCRVKLRVEQVTEVGINENMDSDYYSDIVLVKQENDFYFLSLDSFGNTGEPYKDDNLIIIANRSAIEEIK